MIIAFCGEYAAGKDFLCAHLVENHKAKRLSFSDEVRHLTQKIFDWMPFDFDPAVKDLPFIHPNNPNGLTPRQIWLIAGKVRDVDPKYFVKSFDETNTFVVDDALRTNELYIITDFRTADEWEWLQMYEVPVIKIERESRVGLIPSDFEDYVRKFKDYDALFINRMNGTEDFDQFFKGFLNDRVNQG